MTATPLRDFPGALDAFLRARALDGASFTTEEVVEGTTYANARTVIPPLAKLGNVPVLIAELRERPRRKPAVCYRVNPAWAALQGIGAEEDARLAFDAAAALAEARSLLGGD